MWQCGLPPTDRPGQKFRSAIHLRLYVSYTQCPARLGRCLRWMKKGGQCMVSDASRREHAGQLRVPANRSLAAPGRMEAGTAASCQKDVLMERPHMCRIGDRDPPAVSTVEGPMRAPVHPLLM